MKEDINTVCPHQTIEIVGGGGDETGFFDTFRCTDCGWQYDIWTDGRDEF